MQLRCLGGEEGGGFQQPDVNSSSYSQNVGLKIPSSAVIQSQRYLSFADAANVTVMLAMLRAMLWAMLGN